MSQSPYDAFLTHRIKRWVLRGFSALVLMFLVAPMLAVIPLSFSSGTLLAYPLPGLSTQWYETVANSDRWLVALRNSALVGLAATALAVILGTLAALGLDRARFRGKSMLIALVLSPMVVPSIITAVGLYFFFAPLRLTSTFVGLVLAHAVLAAPFVFVTVSATLESFDRNLAKAGASLGADPVTVFFRVVLPLILPGVASGTVFAFATSFDEVVVVIFLAGPQHRTLPLEMLAGIREQITPEITVVATILSAFALFLLLSIEWLRRKGEARLRATRVV